MRYAMSFAAAFAVALAFSANVNTSQAAPTPDVVESAITYPDGVKVTVRRPGYPDVV